MKRVLVIGHNVFDERTAFGKTLSSFFRGWDPEKIAQLYFHSEVPTSFICQHYYRMTDKDILHSIIKPWQKAVGRSFCAEDIKDDGSASRTDTGITKRLYSFGRKRTSMIYIARNTAWRFGHYKNSGLLDWIQNFSPEVIFFVAGDYAFAYNVTAYIAQKFSVPVIMYCCDDYYVNRLNPHSRFSSIVYRRLMNSVMKLSKNISAIITICGKMTEAYKQIFTVPIYTVYTGYSCKGESNSEANGIVYLGNLGFSRYQSLIEIGRALQSISRKYFLDVYSSEERQHILAHLTEENGIVFHGSVSQEEVRKVISKSALVVHTESFAEENVYKTQFSVSTKIADLLASERCIFAYGPDRIASIEYLMDNDAAIVVSKKEDLAGSLRRGLTDAAMREDKIQHARVLAEKNHSPMVVTSQINRIIDQVGA